MKYQKQNKVSGAWIKGSDLVGITRAKIVSESEPQTSQFKNKDGSVKMQDVCKIRFEGKPDVYNIALNRATINGLIDAFGEDSKSWMNQDLSVETEKVRVAGRVGISIYLIPTNYEKIDNTEGFAEIRKIGGAEPNDGNDDIPVIEEGGVDTIDVKDIPF